MLQKKKKNKRNIRGKILLILAIIACVIGWKAYSIVFSPSLFLKDSKIYDFSIESGSGINNIIDKLEKETNFDDAFGFKLLAKFAELDTKIYPGLYTLTDKMSNKDLVVLFRSGKRKSVKLRIGVKRYAQETIESIAPHIEASKEDLLNLLTNESYIKSLGFSRNNIICLFLPDTYFFNWNTSAEEFYTRMLKEYTEFWNSDRLSKAEEMGLSAKEVMTLASIIDQETNKNDEKPRIAGAYMNRIIIGMPLQADPTVKFALGDFELKRIRKKHTLINSKYNTYMYKGLPPGPICTPSKTGIDAVLNYERHKYLYFCAQPGYSGYHAFATNFDTHLQNARKYQRWLNQEGY